ncbi:uncharacterized protein EI90DRAFT_3156935 [Cantharellus anzutake]|nr:uncharacterized protein EI90DRAFT_3156935 [Cantharellus anzutake]KAF8325582.1 hypothetical protein EI90DRAFT_3156935 [Cantharellus anzutake]
MGIVPSEQVDSTSPPLYHLAQSMSPPPPPAHTSYQPPFRGQRRPAPVPANIAGSAPAPVPPTPAASFTEKVPTYTENVYPNHPRDPGPLNGTTQQLTFDQSMVNTGFYFSDYMQIPMPPTTYLQRPPPSGCLPQPAQISGPSFVMPASNPYQQQNRPVANNPRAQTLTSYIPMDEVQLIGYPSAPQMPYNSGRAIGRNGTGNRNFHG